MSDSASPSATAQRMQQLIENWDTAHDKRAIFLTCYRMMTDNMLVAIDKGEFEDPAWVRSLVDRFADYYFDALDGYETKTHTPPEPWRFAFDAAQETKPYHVLQHLILGVNAHINYDLVFALGDLLGPEWADLSEEQRQSRYRDHCHVNEVIASTTDAVQDQVVERYSSAMGWVDMLFGSFDEWMTSVLINRWRESVWDDAVRMLEVNPDFESEREDMVRQVEANSIERARAILGREGLSGLMDLLT